jgi:hypothetical protein
MTSKDWSVTISGIARSTGELTTPVWEERVRPLLDAAEREDGEVIAKAIADLEAQKARFRAHVPSGPGLLNQLHGHLVYIADLTASMVTREIRSEASVAIKLLWRGESGAARVRAFIRNRRQRFERLLTDASGLPDEYPIEDNSPFVDILYQGAAYFASDNLRALAVQNKYHNRTED